VKIIIPTELKARTKRANHPKAGCAGWIALDSDPRESYAALQTFREYYRKKKVHDDDYLFFSNFDGEKGLFLDIGANIGFSAISFRNVNNSMKILSFEINPLLADVLGLLKHDIADFDFEPIGLSDETSTLSLYVPVHDGLLCTFLASTNLSNFELDYRRKYWLELTGESNFELLEMRVQTVRCDDLGLIPSIIKIDTEGTEPMVINGMEQTINTFKPIIMCENNFGIMLVDWFAERAFASFGYLPDRNELRQLSITDEFQNIFFIHDDRIADMRARRIVRFEAAV
jgi:FkbM family methyltransferase